MFRAVFYLGNVIITRLVMIYIRIYHLLSQRLPRQYLLQQVPLPIWLNTPSPSTILNEVTYSLPPMGPWWLSKLI
jgi:hypothetical protein